MDGTFSRYKETQKKIEEIEKLLNSICARFEILKKVSPIVYKSSFFFFGKLHACKKYIFISICRHGKTVYDFLKRHHE